MKNQYLVSILQYNYEKKKYDIMPLLVFRELKQAKKFIKRQFKDGANFDNKYHIEKLYISKDFE